MKIKSLILFLMVLFFYTSCSDSSTDIEIEPKPEPQPEEELSTTNKMLTFVIEKSNNEDEYLQEDVVGTIKDGEIKLTMSEKIDATKLIASFTHDGEVVMVGDAEQKTGVTVNDFSQLLVYSVVAENEDRQQYIVKVEWMEEQPEKAQIPHIYIDTDGGVPVIEKKVYIEANVRINGGDKYEDFEARGAIRGRGNSTWAMPKKPYRFKLKEKASLLGLAAEKSWVLLQNYIDPSLMCNSVAMKTGQLLEMPFTHHMIPVDVTLNGEYIGAYTFTEHKEVKKNRIDVGEGGWLVELDTYFDEDYQFYSDNYLLPVMIKHPELDKMAVAEAEKILDEMKSDFNVMDGLVFDESFPNNSYLDYFDADAFVDYLIVYMLTGNEEINHPKSTYIYKKKGGKYSMGPIWDFDWAFGYEGTSTHFVNPTRPLFWTGGKAGKGTTFFTRIMEDPAIGLLFKTEWANFRNDNYPILVAYIKEYAETIRESHKMDQKVWGQSSGSIDKYRDRMLDWLDKRVVYMDGVAAGFN